MYFAIPTKSPANDYPKTPSPPTLTPCYNFPTTASSVVKSVLNVLKGLKTSFFPCTSLHDTSAFRYVPVKPHYTSTTVKSNIFYRVPHVYFLSSSLPSSLFKVRSCTPCRRLSASGYSGTTRLKRRASPILDCFLHVCSHSTIQNLTNLFSLCTTPRIAFPPKYPASVISAVFEQVYLSISIVRAR